MKTIILKRIMWRKVLWNIVMMEGGYGKPWVASKDRIEDLEKIFDFKM